MVPTGSVKRVRREGERGRWGYEPFEVLEGYCFRPLLGGVGTVALFTEARAAGTEPVGAGVGKRSGLEPRAHSYSYA